MDPTTKEASLVDHGWLGEGIVSPGREPFDATEETAGQDIDIKPDAEVEWGYGSMAPAWSDAANQHNTVERAPEEQYGDAGDVIVLARDLMNRGATWTQVAQGLKGKFSKETLLAAKEGLRELVAMDGLIGRVMIDGAGYEDCSHALKAAQNSPYKNFIRYVTGCTCGDPVLMESSTGHQMESVVDVPENATDAFFAAEEAPKASKVPHCRKTMLPLISGQGDLDESEMDPTMIDLMNVTGLPEGETEKVMKKKGKGLKKWQHAFQAADRLLESQEEEKYAGPVDVSEHRIDVSDQEIELAGAVDLSQLDVQLTNEEDLNSILLAEQKEAPAALDVDEKAAAIEPDIISFSPQEVEMTQFHEAEFEGIDDFELDAPQDLKAELDVSMAQDMTIN